MPSVPLIAHFLPSLLLHSAAPEGCCSRTWQTRLHCRESHSHQRDINNVTTHLYLQPTDNLEFSCQTKTFDPLKKCLSLHHLLQLHTQLIWHHPGLSSCTVRNSVWRFPRVSELSRPTIHTEEPGWWCCVGVWRPVKNNFIIECFIADSNRNNIPVSLVRRVEAPFSKTKWNKKKKNTKSLF